MSLDLFKHYGDYFGYPLCCVEEFIRFQKNGVILSWKLRPIEQQETARNGFIPCVKHAKEILEGKIRIEDLISIERKHPKPFLRMTKQK